MTLNYRLSAWGFLSSREVASNGATNLGLRDQRLALQWVQENIAAFGGDPRKVTIFGESAGAMSVGYHLTAYGGRDDGLFRGGIMESGGSISAGALHNESYYQDSFDSLAAQVGCSKDPTEDALQCLREVPFEKLNAALNDTSGSPTYLFQPTVDNDFIQTRGSEQLNTHAFVRVPIIAGTNSDEGTSFGPTGINTTQQFYSYLTSNETSDPPLPPSAANAILDVYPDDPSRGIPAYLGNARIPSKGLQWRRTSAYAGDYMMHANRRRQCEAWAETYTPAFCYRFNVRSADADYLQGAMHFEEVAFVFNNIAGRGYHYGKPFRGVPGSYVRLSQMMASMWAAFIHDLDPNYPSVGGAAATAAADGSGNGGNVRWEQYRQGKPVDLLFDANANATSSRMEADTWRKEAIDYINSIADVYNR